MFMDYKWFLLKKWHGIFVYITYCPNLPQHWVSWHFLLKNVLLNHTCISVFAHLPFLRQHIRAPLCKKKQVNMSLRIWTTCMTKILKSVLTYLTLTKWRNDSLLEGCLGVKWWYFELKLGQYVHGGPAHK